jgi:FeS assembly SUF system regulator
MLRISRLTDYATVILASLAQEPGKLRTASALAEQTRLALPTVSKLLKQLQRAGLVASTRGLRGGYQLARPATQITAAGILDALEGPVAITDCASGRGQCDIERTCHVGHAWQRLNLSIRRALDEVTLAQLAGVGDSTRDGQPRVLALERDMKAAVARPVSRS